MDSKELPILNSADQHKNKNYFENLPIQHSEKLFNTNLINNLSVLFNK